MIEQDLTRIANALERIAATLAGQPELLPCDSKPPQSEPQTALPPENEPQADKPQDSAKEPPSVTIEDLRKVLVDTGNQQGRDAVLSVLGRFNARKVSDVSPAQYGEVIAACAKLREGAA